MDPLHVLPPEVLEIVLQCIDIKSVITASEVCQEWHDYIQNTNSLWKIMCMKYCNHCHLQQDRKEGMSWQDTFKRNYGSAETKRNWKTGLYSNISTIEKLPCNKTFSMTLSDWEEVLDLELSR